MGLYTPTGLGGGGSSSLSSFNCASGLILFHGCQKFIDRNGREVGGVIRHGVRKNQFTVVDESSTTINHIRHTAFSLRFRRLEQRLAQSADDLRRVLQIQKERPDAI